MAKKLKGDDHHVRLYVEAFLDTPAWAALSISARVLYAELRAKLGKTNNGDIVCTMETGIRKRRTFKSPTTLAAALAELRALGFIRVTRQGRVSAGSKLPTLYAFTNEPVREFVKEGGYRFGPLKATFDYLEHKTIEEAVVALSAGLATLKEEARKRNKSSASTLQKVKRHAPDSASAQISDASKNAQTTASTLQKMKSLQLPTGSQTSATKKAKGKAGRARGDKLEFEDGTYLARVTCTAPCTECEGVAGGFHLAACPRDPCPKCGALRGKKRCACGGRAPEHRNRLRAGRLPAI